MRKRESRTKSQDDLLSRCAYVFRSLKHPDEVSTLRKIYGPGCILVAAYSPRETRLQNLAKKIANSHQAFQSTDHRANAESLIQRDQAEAGKKFGQNVRKTFSLADVFIDASDPVGLRDSITRFIELLFGYPFHTPTRDEYGMFHAQAAALRSSSLSRQVGAAVSTEDGAVVAVGTNEVPKAQGGLYWSGDTPDRRDFVLGYDTSDRMKRKLLADVLKRLQDAEWFAEEKGKKDVEVLIDEAQKLMAGAQVMNVIEFNRAVHAEMAALVDAARRSSSVEGCTLYTTTFPCHDCAKHIVAAGIRRVVYIEPYPKSLVPELYLDSIIVDNPGGASAQVSFEPFVGIAPRLYMDLFTMVKRKQDNGEVVDWNKNKSQVIPRLHGSHPSYLRNEKDEIDALYGAMEQQGLKPVD